MYAPYQQTIAQTLIQVRRNRLEYYSHILYTTLAVCGVIGLFIGVHYWKKYSPRIQEVRRQQFRQLQLFRNAMREELY
jgi:uncharacterized protein (DUF2461 family)